MSRAIQHLPAYQDIGETVVLDSLDASGKNNPVIDFLVSRFIAETGHHLAEVAFAMNALDMTCFQKSPEKGNPTGIKITIHKMAGTASYVTLRAFKNAVTFAARLEMQEKSQIGTDKQSLLISVTSFLGSFEGMQELFTRARDAIEENRGNISRKFIDIHYWEPLAGSEESSERRYWGRRSPLAVAAA